MKALTLTQPWAQLIAIGAKKIETRSWSTNHYGPLAIHAAKGLGPVGGKSGLTWQCSQEPFLTHLQTWADKQSWHDLKDLVERPLMPRGAIVAVARLVRCVSTVGSAIWKPKPDTDEYAFGNYEPGRFMWMLEDVCHLHKPVECKGALGLWKVPDDVAAAVAEQLPPMMRTMLAYEDARTVR